jgi:hypothetical protein
MAILGRGARRRGPCLQTCVLGNLVV